MNEIVQKLTIPQMLALISVDPIWSIKTSFYLNVDKDLLCIDLLWVVHSKSKVAGHVGQKQVRGVFGRGQLTKFRKKVN